VPSLEHEAPLLVLREAPALVPALLREALGVVLPSFAEVELEDADFTQAMPAERRADLVVRLRTGPAAEPPAMGVIVEVQRARDDEKRCAWPMYAAALHARLRCPICLVVIATDEGTARWAATPITTLQYGSAFVPLVLGPAQIPRLSIARARREPWLAILAGLAHGNRPDGAEAIRAVAAALEVLPGAPAGLCYDLVWASSNEAARRVLEDEMQSGKYEYQSDFARRFFGEGREAGRQEGRQEGEVEGARGVVLALIDRHGPMPDALRTRVAACDGPALRALAVELAAATDRRAVERLLAALPPTCDA